jgi:hypothetical protein
MDFVLIINIVSDKVFPLALQWHTVITTARTKFRVVSRSKFTLLKHETCGRVWGGG